MSRFDDLTAGMLLYDIHRHTEAAKLQNDLCAWRVLVLAVDRETRTAIVSWNGQKPKTWPEEKLVALVTEPPEDYLDQRRRKKERANVIRRDHEWSRT